MKEELDKIVKNTRARRIEHPEEGMLLIVTYVQVIPPDESIIRPNPRYEDIDVSFGKTQEEALKTYLSIPRLKQGYGPNYRLMSQQVWLPPGE